MTTHNEKWEAKFDDEVDRLVARSLRDPDCKPLTELKSFIRTNFVSLAAVKEAAKKLYKGHDSIVQLGVVEQGTTEGKLHYQREYGKREGYNSALSDLLSSLGISDKDHE